MKHTMVKLLCNGQLFYAPISENPQKILDIGTGTGIWAIESEQQSPIFVSASQARFPTDVCGSDSG